MFFDNFCAITRNKVVKDRPIKNVIHGILAVAPGANKLMTKEPKVILALSKKKSQFTLVLSLDIIKDKFTTIEAHCQGAKGQEKVTGVLG